MRVARKTTLICKGESAQNLLPERCLTDIRKLPSCEGSFLTIHYATIYWGRNELQLGVCVTPKLERTSASGMGKQNLAMSKLL